MTTFAKKRPNWLLNLAAKAMAPLVGGCAGLLVSAYVAPGVGKFVGKGVEKAIDVFGRYIVVKWQDWFAKQPAKLQDAAVNELANLTPAEARAEAKEAIDEAAPNASPEEKQLAVEYLTAIPNAVRQSLVPDPSTGAASVPRGVSLTDPKALLALLPADVPPYAAPVQLPDTAYRLEEMIGVGGFGAVYRASASAMQHLPLAIKFCLDARMLPALHQERNILERLSKTGTDAWSPFIVRLYGYDLEHATPFLVYEYVPGGDLARRVTADRIATAKPPPPAQVLQWVVAITRGLAFVHGQGLVHRDLKPANVLLGAHNPKLADFGIGGVVSSHAVQHSRLASHAADGWRSSEHASLIRGAGTPLYMSIEQRQGHAPDPRHDLYSLGVLWYQLLVGDVTRELHTGWADELKEDRAIPAYQIELIESCVGWIKKRPRDANDLLDLLKAKTISKIPILEAAPTPAAPRRVPAAPLLEALEEALPVPPLEAIPVAEPVEVLRPVNPKPSSHRKKPAEPSNVAKVRVRLLGTRGTSDADLQVLCNGELVGTGSFSRGFDVPLKLPLGRHQIVVKHWGLLGWTEASLPLAFSQPGSFEVRIRYRTDAQRFELETIFKV
jgi:serine/threonine protein kinase